MKIETSSIAADDGVEIPVIVATPDVRRAPSVAVIPAVYGLSRFARSRAEALARAGNFAMVMDPFHRVAPSGPIMDLQTALERARKVDFERTMKDLEAVIGVMKKHDRSDRRTFAVGICFGGRFAVCAAADGLVQGAASWHGGGLESVLDRAESIECPLSLQFGANDQVITLATVGRIRTALAGKDNVRIDVHPDAEHGFTEIGHRSYDGSAERAATRDLADIIRSVPVVIPD